MCVFVFFFFKQKTAYEMRISDWSSDVCSSDLPEGEAHAPINQPRFFLAGNDFHRVTQGKPRLLQEVHGAIGPTQAVGAHGAHMMGSSEERSVGKEWVSPCRSRW